MRFNIRREYLHIYEGFIQSILIRSLIHNLVLCFYLITRDDKSNICPSKAANNARFINTSLSRTYMRSKTNYYHAYRCCTSYFKVTHHSPIFLAFRYLIKLWICFGDQKILYKMSETNREVSRPYGVLTLLAHWQKLVVPYSLLHPVLWDHVSLVWALSPGRHQHPFM